MASLNLTVEDSSSIIHYDGGWTNPSLNDDSTSQSYSGSSFHTTSTQGATATINFNGTGINVWAGSRPNYGSYKLTVDGNVVAQGSAVSTSGQTEFNKLLASSTGLSNGPHTAVFENTGNGPIDLDKVDLLTQIGLPGSQLTTTTYDDTDSAWKYGPSESDWRVNDASGFTNSTLHYSNSSQATATLTWNNGDAFSIWTTAAPDHMNFEITLDGQSIANCSGGAGAVSGVRANTMMHLQTGLSPGQHTLTIAGNGGGPFLDLDAVQVYSSTGGNPNGSGTGSSSSTSASHSLSPGVIAGIVIGSLVGLLLIFGAIFFLLRRRRDLLARGKSSNLSSELPVQVPSMMEAGLGGPASISGSGGRPVSNASSFFALDRDPHSDASSIHSTTPMIPIPMAVASNNSSIPRTHYGSSTWMTGPTLDASQSAGWNQPLDRPARPQHQSVHVEVVYPQ